MKEKNAEKVEKASKMVSKLIEAIEEMKVDVDGRAYEELLRIQAVLNK